ncbi:hypothetical protein QPK87_04495, partial [Kamptonema cortianum]|nr:hypothetical protein [Kamptonema cortianum]
ISESLRSYLDAPLPFDPLPGDSQVIHPAVYEHYRKKLAAKIAKEEKYAPLSSANFQPHQTWDGDELDVVQWIRDEGEPDKLSRCEELHERWSRSDFACAHGW